MINLKKKNLSWNFTYVPLEKNDNLKIILTFFWEMKSDIQEKFGELWNNKKIFFGLVREKQIVKQVWVKSLLGENKRDFLIIFRSKKMRKKIKSSLIKFFN